MSSARAALAAARAVLAEAQRKHDETKIASLRLRWLQPLQRAKEEAARAEAALALALAPAP